MENPFRRNGSSNNGDTIDGDYDPLTATPESMLPRFIVLKPVVVISKELPRNGNEQKPRDVKKRKLEVVATDLTASEAQKRVVSINQQAGIKSLLPWNRAIYRTDNLTN